MATPFFDITSANAVAVMTVDTLFPSGIFLQMFATDSALTMESIDVAETRMGVDGHMVAGYTPNIVPVTVTLEAASPTASSFSAIWQASRMKRGIYECTLTLTVPSIAKVFTYSKGVMRNGMLLPSLKKVLEPTSWLFHFERVTAAGL